MLFKVFRKYYKAFVWVIAIGIIPTFIIWNIAASTQQRKQLVGEMFGKKVYMDEFSKAQQAVISQSWLKYGDDYKKFINVDDETWTRLILLHRAKTQKIRVSEAEIFSEIQGLPVFKQYGRLDPRTYRSILMHALHITPIEFEQEIKKTLVISKLVDTVIRPLEISDDELKNTYNKEHEKAKASYLLFLTDAYQQNIIIDDASISDYFKQHPADFNTPLKRNVEYVEFKYQDFSDNNPISEEEINKYYADHKNQFPPPATDEAKEPPQPLPLEAARDKIVRSLEQQRQEKLAEDAARKFLANLPAAKQDFLETAKTSNVSARQTGFFDKNQEIPGIGLSYEFSEQAFSLKENSISPLIKTTRAYYILRIIGEEKPRPKTMAESLEEIKQLLGEDKARQLCRQAASDTLKQITPLIAEAKKTFAEAAAELNLARQTTEPFSRSGYIKNLGLAKDFSQAVFNLKPGEISQVIPVPRGFCIVSPDEFYPVSEEDFNKNKDLYKRRLLFQRQNERLNAWFEQVKKEANLKNYLGLLKQLAETGNNPQE